MKQSLSERLCRMEFCQPCLNILYAWWWLRGKLQNETSETCFNSGRPPPPSPQNNIDFFWPIIKTIFGSPPTFHFFGLKKWNLFRLNPRFIFLAKKKRKHIPQSWNQIQTSWNGRLHQFQNISINIEQIFKNASISTTFYTQIPVGLVVREGGHYPEVNLREGHLLEGAATMQNVYSTYPVVNRSFPQQNPPKPYILPFTLSW